MNNNRNPNNRPPVPPRGPRNGPQGVPPRNNMNGGSNYPPVRHRSRKKAYRAAGLVALTVIIMGMLLVSVIIFAARCATGRINEPEGTDGSASLPITSADNLTSPPATSDTAPVTTAPEIKFDSVKKTAADIHKGYLILVNYQNIYTFETDFKLQPFYGNKNKSYKLRDTLVSLDKVAMDWCNKMMEAFDTETGHHDILVNSSFRTLEEQEQLYTARVRAYGEEYAKNYVAMPGYSEHHTGLAVDFTVYTDKNESKTFDDLTEYPEWLTANAHKYGYIQRYPSDKTDITKIAYENWHYRYIGKPHAYYIKTNGICLEEYIDELRKYPFDGKHLSITDDEGAVWEVYFVPSAGESTDVPVPKDDEYTLSGNNVDGFIVTVEKDGKS